MKGNSVAIVFMLLAWVLTLVGYASIKQEYKQIDNMRLLEISLQDSLLQVKSDSIKVLKEQNFKLTTIKQMRDDSN